MTGGRTEAVELARQVFEIERSALDAVASRLDGRFNEVCKLVLAARGRVILFGMGKSGLIARKVAATLASTGTPAAFIHPGDAVHGDLGMVAAGDVAFVISNSGETEELLRLVPHLHAREVPVVAFIARKGSSLARQARLVLDVEVPREACSLNLTPTSSTTAALVMGDAIAVALASLRGFDAADFERLHPAGFIGQRLLAQVRDVMHADGIPSCAATTTLHQVLRAMSAGRLGLTLVLADGVVQGIITDGDVRRAVEASQTPLELTAGDMMTPSPRVARPDERFIDAEQRMLTHKINSLVVVDENGKAIGIVQIYDGRATKSWTPP